MMKDIVIVVSFLLVFSLATPCSAQDVSTPDAALDSAQRERSAKPAVGMPQWESSLGDIQQTTSALIEINAKLTAEYQQLDREIQSASQAILAQKERNKERTLALVQRQHDLAEPAVEPASGAAWTELEAVVRQKRDALQLLRARARSLQSRLELHQIKTRELDLEKKSLMVDLKAKYGASAEEARAEIETLRAEISSQSDQEKDIWKKISDLPRGAAAGMSPAQSLVFEVSELKQKLAGASAQEQAALSRIADIQDQRKRLESDPMIATYNHLLADRRDLNARVLEQQRKISEFERSRNAGRQVVNDLKDKFIVTEKKNKAITQEVDNLRENVALLEYKISSMQNDEDRNQQKGR
jgi:regulator of replication initiation timing